MKIALLCKPEAKTTDNRSRRTIRILLCVSCLLLGFLAMSQYLSLIKTKEEIFVEGKTYDELAADYIVLLAKNESLQTRNSDLADELSRMKGAQNDDEDSSLILTDEMRASQREAGFLSVYGEGLVITIDADSAVTVNSNMIIQLLNEIKASDAQAIAINGQRCVAMTEVRDTVSGFTVNGASFSYADDVIIMATGNSVNMYNALQMVGGVLDKWTEKGVDFHIEISESIAINAIDEETASRMDLSAYTS